MCFINLKSPPNTGNVGRTCVAVSAKLWLVRPLGFRLDEKTVRRAGLDYWQHLDWEVADDWEQLVDKLREHRFWFFTKHATKTYTAADYEVGDVLVFGSETSGLPQTLLAERPSQAVRIPQSSSVRSLNLSNAVAVAAYEALRQWEV